MFAGVLRAAAAYFAVTFAAGFALGTIRVAWLVPVVGERAAELMEMPVMVAVVMGAFEFANITVPGPLICDHTEVTDWPPALPEKPRPKDHEAASAGRLATSSDSWAGSCATSPRRLSCTSPWARGGAGWRMSVVGSGGASATRATSCGRTAHGRRQRC